MQNLFLKITTRRYLCGPMLTYIPFTFKDNIFLISSDRSIFWEEEKALILSDMHLGKSGHFRKSGIAIPQTVLLEDMQRFISQIQFFKPKKIIIVGDLFHSSMNKEHDFFLKWRNDISNIDIFLIQGNHDILKTEWYEAANIKVVKHSLNIGAFSFIHDINDCELENVNYCFSGHIHPAVKLSGNGKQSLRLPCFYFGEQYAILPAFGKFTGTSYIEPKKGDAVFCMVEGKVMKM